MDNARLYRWIAVKEKQAITAQEMRKWMVGHRPWNVRLMHAIYLCVISVRVFFFFYMLVLFGLKQAQGDKGQIDSERDVSAG